MALTIGQVTTARTLIRAAIKGSLEIENAFDDLIEKQTGNIKGTLQDLEGLLQLVKAMQGALVEQPEPAPVAAPAAAPPEQAALVPEVVG